jgi:hypothetical protein
MRRLCSVLVFAFVMGAASVACAEDKTANAPADDPRVVAARQIYESVESSAGELKEERFGIFCYRYTSFTHFVDKNNTIRKYVSRLRLVGSAYNYTFRFYYDLPGYQRFLFATAIALNGKILRLRVFYDEQGKPIRMEMEPVGNENRMLSIFPLVCIEHCARNANNIRHNYNAIPIDHCTRF